MVPNGWRFLHLQSYWLLALLLLAAPKPAPAAGVSVTNLYSFTGGSDGAFPWAPLLQTAGGGLYGTTQYGGVAALISGYGSVFQLGLNGSFNSIYAFAVDWDGHRPGLGGLVEGTDGNLYGTTTVGGDYGLGTVFTVLPSGFSFPIYSFGPSGTNGVSPRAGVTLARDGSLYGTTELGGDRSAGAIVRVTGDWNFSRLFSFNGTNGANPYCALVQGSDGGLYGTTFRGGAGYKGYDNQGRHTGNGTVFRIGTNGTFSSLFSFSGTNGAQPVAGLVQTRNGSLYGTTQLGGASGYGTVFKITTNGSFTLLYSFKGGADSGYPVGRLMEASDGNLYGTTAGVAFLDGDQAPSAGNGVIFRVDPSGTVTKLYAFPGRPDGIEPLAALVQANDGCLYGTCLGGANGAGMIFRCTIPMTPLVRTDPKGSNQITLNWNTVVGMQYQAQYATNVYAAPWNNLGSLTTATNGWMSRTESIGAGSRFYRVILKQ